MPIFKIIRAVTRPIILAAEHCCVGTPLQREPEAQRQVDEQTQTMTIYEYPACPFCMITRRNVRRLNLNIERRDAMNDAQHKQELVEGGGKNQVPCLRIETKDGIQWMYESQDIIDYLKKQFGKAA